MFYKTLGFVVWQIGRRAVKRKVGVKLPVRALGAGVLLAVLAAGAAVALRKRQDAAVLES